MAPRNRRPADGPAMHELSIALSILDCAAEEAERRGAEEVVAVHLKLGPLSGVVREALATAYDSARERAEPTLRQSRLVIEELPVTVYCPACEQVCEPPSIQEMRCPVCGTPTPDIRGGRELEVFAMEIYP